MGSGIVPSTVYRRVSNQQTNMTDGAQFGNSILSVSSASTVKLGNQQVNLNEEIVKLINPTTVDN